MCFRKGNAMKLSIRNLAKIKQADIELKGITIIAGENDSGKSTVGKALAAMFDVFHEVNDYARTERHLALAQLLLTVAKESNDEAVNLYKNRFDVALDQVKLLVTLEKYELKDAESAKQIMCRIAHEKYGTDIKANIGIFTKFSSQVEAIMSLTYGDIIARRLEDKFNAVFSQQVNSLYNLKEAEVSLLVQGKALRGKLLQNKCSEISYELSLQHDAIFIANPYLIDYTYETNRLQDALSADLIAKLREKKKENLLRKIIRQKNIQQFLDKLAELVPGEFIEKNDDLYLNCTGMRNAINVKNLSVGVKTFAIIRRLLENGWLEENGVLIFDEPEIHVHPKWQLVFAEIIVMLQKYFNMTILLTTHSPYFINALEVYSVKYGIKDLLTAYVSNLQEGMAEFEDVTDHMDRVYTLLAEPFNELEELRFALGMEN